MSMTPVPRRITSRDNPFLKTLRQLSQDNTAYRRLGKLWVEGEHLCLAARARGVAVQHWVFSEAGWADRPAELQVLEGDILVVSDALFAGLSDLPSPARMGCVLALPPTPTLHSTAHTLVLDRVQDAGNVGSMLRSAAAFGATQILALKGTAALWSPKVLRAAMGAHFGLRLVEGVGLEALQQLSIPLVATHPHQGPWLHELSSSRELPHPCAWVLGHEGQGVQEALLERASLSVRIAQPGGEESLNVAAAAAICLYASATAR